MGIQLIDLYGGKMRSSAHQMEDGDNSIHMYGDLDHRHGGGSSRRLGVGINIGMTGHHHHYKPSLNELSLLASQGATERQFKEAYALTKVGMNEEKREEKEEEGKRIKRFGGFKGYDGFGSGYYDDDKGKKRDDDDGGDEDDVVPGVSAGVERGRRKLMVDSDDMDIYEYDAMENERKCLVFGYNKVRQICVGHEYVEIKEFVKRKEKKKKITFIDENAVIC